MWYENSTFLFGCLTLLTKSWELEGGVRAVKRNNKRGDRERDSKELNVQTLAILACPPLCRHLNTLNKSYCYSHIHKLVAKNQKHHCTNSMILFTVKSLSTDQGKKKAKINQGEPLNSNGYTSNDWWWA